MRKVRAELEGLAESQTVDESLKGSAPADESVLAAITAQAQAMTGRRDAQSASV